MAIQYYGSTHLSPNIKYTVTIDLPGVYKEWSFISQVTTDINQQPVYCGMNEVRQELGTFTTAFTNWDILFAIKDSSNRLEDFLLIQEIDYSSLYDAELRAVNLAIKMYVRYKASLDLANQIFYELVNAGGRESKRLGNLQIDKQGPSLLIDLAKVRQHLAEQFAYWEGRLIYVNTGAVKPVPKVVVRGNNVSPYSLATRTF